MPELDQSSRDQPKPPKGDIKTKVSYTWIRNPQRSTSPITVSPLLNPSSYVVLIAIGGSGGSWRALASRCPLHLSFPSLCWGIPKGKYRVRMVSREKIPRKDLQSALGIGYRYMANFPTIPDHTPLASSTSKYPLNIPRPSRTSPEKTSTFSLSRPCS